MRVLYIVFEFQHHVSGGLARVINGVVPELCKHLEVDVLHLYTNRWYMSRFDVYRCNENHYARPIRRNKIPAFWNIYKLIEEEGYDIIHFFYVYNTMSDLMKEIKRRFPEKKMVYSVHNLVKHEKNIRMNPPGYFECEEKMFELADRVHVLNHASLSYFQSAYPAIACRKEVSVITNGLQEDSFASKDEVFRQKLDKMLHPDKRTVVSVTRWAHGKGLEYLLEGAEKILAQRNDVQFVLAGRKTKSWEKDGKKYVDMIDRKVKQLAPHVISIDWINEAQRNTLFDAADVYVMPSELEYFSYGSLEPLMCEVPLVQSNIDCLKEMLSDGEDCLFYDTKDADDLCRKLNRMLNDPNFARQTAMNGSRKLKNEYKWSMIAERYFEMYKQVFAPAYELA